MTLAERATPNWAVLERMQDQQWIRENRDVFWHMAAQGFQVGGRGAVFVDVAARPMGDHNLFTYFTAEQIAYYENEAIDQLVKEYDPTEEFVIVLLKPEQKLSSYRIWTLLPDTPWEEE